MINTDNIMFYEMEWDTKHFGIPCAKAILKDTVTQKEWEEVRGEFSSYKFVSIQNLNSNAENAQLIGKDTKAFLVDVNVQFIKKVIPNSCETSNVVIDNNFERDDRLVDLAYFKHSKFINDLNLKSRGGAEVYPKWVINSFNKEDKYFIVSYDADNIPDGFLIFYFKDELCVIDLIASTPGKGIGTKMFKALENEAVKKGLKEIKVGTQIENKGAVNFYHKLGFKQVECHQVFHLWNL